MYTILFISYLFLSLVACLRTPTISYISQEQIKDIGDTVDLECSVQYAQEYPVIWMKIDNTGISRPLPISSGTAMIIRDNRFSLSLDSHSSTYKLQIKDIQETDAGVYHCQVIMAVNNEISANVDLLVRRPPIIAANSTSSLVVSEGEDIQLECYAFGYPYPRISWRRENNAILSTGASIFRGNLLNITSVQKEDRGTYYCVAENGVGKGARRNIAVEVEFKPVITVPRPRLGQALQYDMDLECHIVAYPPPAIVWVKDSVQLSNNQHYSISNFATADEYTDTTIRIITIEKRQYGKYTCKATNRLGSAEAEVELFESIIPVCPPACEVAQYGDAVQATTSIALVLISTLLLLLRCISYLATADDYTETTIRILTIEEQQYGNYTCKATNKLGSAEAEVELFESIIPVCPPACVQAQNGDSVQTTTSITLVDE